MIGVYAIKNKITGKMYIGESTNITSRWKTHKQDLNNNTHHSYKLQKEWNEYGESSFQFRIIENFAFAENLIIDKRKLKIVLLCREFYNIKKFNTIENGYNIELTLKEVIRGNCKNQDLTDYLGEIIKPEIKSHMDFYKDGLDFEKITNYVQCHCNDNTDTIIIPPKRKHKNEDLLLISRINKYIQSKLGMTYTNHQLKDLFVDMGYLQKLSEKTYMITKMGFDSGYLEQGNIYTNGYNKNKILLTPDGIDFVIEYLKL